MCEIVIECVCVHIICVYGELISELIGEVESSSVRLFEMFAIFLSVGTST